MRLATGLFRRNNVSYDMKCGMSAWRKPERRGLAIPATQLAKCLLVGSPGNETDSRLGFLVVCSAPMTGGVRMIVYEVLSDALDTQVGESLPGFHGLVLSRSR